VKAKLTECKYSLCFKDNARQIHKVYAVAKQKKNEKKLVKLIQKKKSWVVSDLSTTSEYDNYFDR